VLVSGIPGSGKGRLANSIAKLLLPLQLKTAFFKMPTVQ
jgi:adenylate kinase family enzyme